MDWAALERRPLIPVAGPKQTDLDIVYAGDGTIVAGAKDTGVCAGDSGGPVLPVPGLL